MLSVITWPLFSFAQEQDPELGIYEKLDDYIPSDLTYVSEKYDTVNLLSVIDKPTVLVPVYYNCPGICTPLLEGVADVISKSDQVIGIDSLGDRITEIFKDLLGKTGNRFLRNPFFLSFE